MSADSDSDSEVTKCIRCDKPVSGNTIGCDICEGWLHLKCAGFKLKEFYKICEDVNTKFICRYCKFYQCGKCSKPVYPTQNGIQCDIDNCEKWYHLRCTKFTMAEYLSKSSRLHTENWYCPLCISFPFSDLSQKAFTEVVKPDCNLKTFFSKRPGINAYKNCCSVCTRKITKNQHDKSFPCSECKSLIHRKCSNISPHELINCKPSHLKRWSCNSCMASQFPFQNIAASEVEKMSFNSLFSCPCLADSSDVPNNCDLEFRLTDNLYDRDSIFTHGPDPHNNIDTTLDINARCNYYTNHEFHKLKHELTTNGNAKPFSVLHTNIESLNHNFDALEQLCIDLDFPFDVIGLTETWDPAYNKDKFIPKLLDNYQKYNGLQGTTLKSGCGLYIRSDLKFKDR
jgi:hypothetical protein